MKTPRSGARGGMTRTAGSLTACLGLLVGGCLDLPVPSWAGKKFQSHLTVPPKRLIEEINECKICYESFNESFKYKDAPFYVIQNVFIISILPIKNKCPICRYKK